MASPSADESMMADWDCPEEEHISNFTTSSETENFKTSGETDMEKITVGTSPKSLSRRTSIISPDEEEKPNEKPNANFLPFRKIGMGCVLDLVKVAALGGSLALPTYPVVLELAGH